MVSSICTSIAYERSCGTAGMARRSVERTKKLPWNEDMRRSSDEMISKSFESSIGPLTLRCTNTHDSLQHDGHGEDLAELMRKLDSVFCPRSVERWVEERLASGVVWQASCKDTCKSEARL